MLADRVSREVVSCKARERWTSRANSSECNAADDCLLAWYIRQYNLVGVLGACPRIEAAAREIWPKWTFPQ